MNIDILGQTWEVIRAAEDEFDYLCDADGFTDFTTRQIVVKKVKKERGSVDDLEFYMKKVTRHEIVHAFLFESGIHINSLKFEDGWATNEEMIDWFAFQGQKIYKAWQEACAL